MMMLVRCLVRKHTTKLKFKSFSLIHKLLGESILKKKYKTEKVGDVFKVYCSIFLRSVKKNFPHE
jgi:hypothetical protein